jgi:hypothetical protein
MNILHDLWADTAGKIFLLTIASYLFGYLVYGGYLGTFFRRIGNVPFGFTEFSVADLISIFPTAIITILNIIPRAFLDIIVGLLKNVIVPFAVGLLIRSTTGYYIGRIPGT